MSPVVLWVGGLMLAAAAIIIVVRIERGPSMLDRTIALDMLVGVVIAALALWSAAAERTDLVNVLVVLSLVGFVGSVTLARFVAVEPEDEGRILTPEEVRAHDGRMRASLAKESKRRVGGREDAMRRAYPESEDPR
ncbi:monovalent cation/H+ antiporter complex subunit F [Pseudactinotalea suaedae]|jgi:multicomponent Na+:H+ antiporter subunit F|uniref:monovalent cation/H+ antiporter complex subunit F n=1 Tax=Pseudactinotalea suaedae TaxID=1524924 RepID=UPI0012E21859|nr:monovalent cation/H+ antiporter complex subunit F [Pseudactinotalea suaedae]